MSTDGFKKDAAGDEGVVPASFVPRISVTFTGSASKPPATSKPAGEVASTALAIFVFLSLRRNKSKEIVEITWDALFCRPVMGRMSVTLWDPQYSTASD
ncbi:hypothetical protein V5799_018738 [Amblyomma americanum]|uniref:Uncharacterized protein n=1 Tax=Amblyomma americanum TaxID=6943 RepID=A0AAQ4EZG2_AMBAM